MSDVWHDLTGAPTFYKYLKEFNANTLFTTLQDYFKKGYAVGIATPMNKAETGDVEKHAYAVLGAYVVTLDNGSQARLIKIMNPWHRDEFKTNPWRDGSSYWTAKVKSQVPFSGVDTDGEYFVEINDVMRNYQALMWGEIQSGYDGTYQDIWFQNQKSDYQTQFTVKNNQNKNIWIEIDEPEERLLKKGCQPPYQVQSLTVQTPSGQTLNADYENIVFIQNAQEGTYKISARVQQSKSYARYFTISAYALDNAVQFIDQADNIKPNFQQKSCPNDCSKHGRCNFYNGKCTCYAGVKF